jgi:3-dehydroquinate synthase
VRAHLVACGFELSPARLGLAAPAAQLVHHMRQDKKMSAGTLPFILARGIGKAFVARDVPLGDVEAFLGDIVAG